MDPKTPYKKDKVVATSETKFYKSMQETKFQNLFTLGVPQHYVLIGFPVYVTSNKYFKLLRGLTNPEI